MSPGLVAEAVGDRGRMRRSVVVGLVAGVPLSALFLYLALRHVDAPAVVAAMRGARLPYVLLAVAAMAAVYVVQAFRWRTICGLASPPSLGRFVEYVVASVACNNVVPGRPGDLLRIEWLARGARLPRTHALATVIVDRGADVLTLAAALGVTYGTVSHPAWLRHLSLAALVVIALVASGLLASGIRGRVVGRLLGRGRIGRLASDVRTGIGHALDGGRAVVIAGLSLLSWGTWALGAWLVAHAVGVPVTPAGAVFVAAVLNLGSAIPSSPGFVGTYQWLSIAALGLLGTAREEAIAFSVVMQAVWFVPTTLVGAFIGIRASAFPVLSDSIKAVKAHA